MLKIIIKQLITPKLGCEVDETLEESLDYIFILEDVLTNAKFNDDDRICFIETSNAFVSANLNNAKKCGIRPEH